MLRIEFCSLNLSTEKLLYYIKIRNAILGLLFWYIFKGIGKHQMTQELFYQYFTLVPVLENPGVAAARECIVIKAGLLLQLAASRS